jgi:hypothetical protein
MRVRILRKPPATYTLGMDTDALLVGRVYNLAASVASALMVDGYAELYETLSADEKREIAGHMYDHGWTAADHMQRWRLPDRKKKKR